MRVTNGQVLAAWQVKEVLQELIAQTLPIKTAYGLAKLARRLPPLVMEIETVKNALIERYGEKNEQGMPQITGQSPGWQEFWPQYQELLGQETEIDINPIVLPERDDIYIKASELMALEGFVEVA